jgi:hypothetical protein
MTRRYVGAALAFSLCLTSSAFADVKSQDKTLVKFEGALGRVMNFFGGKAAKEGVKTTVAVQGDRKATFGENDGTIVDLREEKVYDLDMKKKSYTVVTFAEMRRRMEEARKKAEEQARKEAPEEEKKADEKAPEIEVDFSVKETGERKTINGFDTKQVLMTITMREKGRTLEQSGGLVMTSDLWITPSIAAMKELMDFEVRYAKQLAGPETFGASAEQMQAALAAHPMLKEGLARMAEESRKMEGTAILTITTMDAVKSAEQMAAQQSQKAEEPSPDASGGVGGLIGGFGRRMAKKKASGGDDPAPKAQATFMTITHERLSVSTAVAGSDLAIPAGFKESK